MKIKKLFKKIPCQTIKGSKEVKITGLSTDSKTVAPGNLFLAKKGKNFDGSDFITEAIAAGAVAVVSDLYNPFFSHVVQIIHEDVAQIEADIAATYYGFPSRKLKVAGITGTKGKTTTTYLLKHFLDFNQKPAGLLGTVEYIVGKNHYLSNLTTPSALTLQKFLKEMVEAKIKTAVMEVSSHAIDLGRCKHIDFDVGIFTNLTQDHLDYHQTIENYAKVKAEFFWSLKKESLAVINLDDPYAAFMVEKSPAKVVTYGINQPADLRAEEINFSAKGLEFTLLYKNQREHFTSKLIGLFNVYNILAAAAAALNFKISLKQIKNALSSFQSVRGRLERVDLDKDFTVFVDYAHTEDSLRNVLVTLNALKKGRLITVFGCGGNRDQLKRPKMGGVAAQLSDFCVITTDNPRKEEPKAIIRQILEGVSKENRDKCLIEEDRFEAIKKALLMAQKDDLVLIAGKGHEAYQIFRDRTIVFDDREVVKEICQTF